MLFILAREALIGVVVCMAGKLGGTAEGVHFLTLQLHVSDEKMHANICLQSECIYSKSVVVGTPRHNKGECQCPLYIYTVYHVPSLSGEGVACNDGASIL